MDLSGKLVGLSGATGFIGGHLVRRLLGEGCRVRALVRDSARAEKLASLGVQLVSGDLTDAGGLAAAFAGCDIVYHAAAYVGEAGDRDAVWAVNVHGTEHMIQAAHEAGVQRFIHLSSCAVYGSPQVLGIDEETPIRLKGEIYHDSKVAADAAVQRAVVDLALPAVIARPSQVYGPGSTQFTVRPVQLIRAGRMVLIDGGRHYCKPVYIDDLIDGLIACAEAEAALGEAINFTDNEPVTWRIFFGAYGRMCGVESFRSIPYPLAWLLALAYEVSARLRGRKASFNRRAIAALRSINSFSNRKAERLLGWTPQIDLSEGMRRTEVWLREAGHLPASPSA